MVKKYFRGFTLVEILIVVSLVVFLVLMGMIYLRTQVFKGTDAKRKTDLKKIQIAAEEYEKDHNCYPLPQFVACSPGTLLRPYIDKVPCDPTTHSSYYYEHEDSFCPSWYIVYAKLDNSEDSDITPAIGPFGAYNYYASSPNAPNLTPGPTAPPTSGPTAPPGGGGGGGGGSQSSFYGCKSGVCVPISWDSSRPGPECDPNYQSSVCYGQCGFPITECIPWH